VTAERWARIRQVYDAALDLPAVDREAFVREHASGDPELCLEALAMLRNSSEDGGLLDISLFGRQWVRPATLARMLTPGQTLAGRYRIVRPIGAGGMGEVYEAEDLEFGARVAVKTMRVEDADALANFKREIQLARTVTHPNVCRIFDLHRHHDPESGSVVTFLTMELVDGETLTAHLARHGALTPAETLPIAQQIGAGLTAAHEKGVVHRDLKAGNVMLAGNGLGGIGQRVVVTDFGLAHILTQATESSVTIAGTPAYMAPEQFEGKHITAAVDIYAFGVLLYEMVAGRRPFAGDSPIALALDKIRKQPPRAGDTVPALPPVWSDVIRRCMDPDPHRRFAHVSDALNLLRKTVDRPPLIRLSRKQKRIGSSVLVFLGWLGLGAWLYTRSTYSPSFEALRLYRSGAHAQQLGLPWKAAQLYEQALARDERFIAARASLAEAWMDLDQPRRASVELQRAATIRPRWRRVEDYESLLEQAAQAQLRGALKQAVVFHQRAGAAAPESEKPDVLMSEAVSNVRAGDMAEAIARYAALEKTSGEKDPPGRCAALMAHAGLTLTTQPFQARRLFEDSRTCFEAAGDLDGVAQNLYERERPGRPERATLESVRQALTIAQSTGNVEQEILFGALLSRYMLEIGEEDEAYAAFSRSMQIADRNGLKFMTARLLNERAEYHFDKGDFLQADNVGGLALSVSRFAGMPWTNVNCEIRGVKANLRMGLLISAGNGLASAREQLRQFPNAALSAQITDLENLAKRTRERPEGR
jgi:serine/threonine protein kinase